MSQLGEFLQRARGPNAGYKFADMGFQRMELLRALDGFIARGRCDDMMLCPALEDRGVTCEPFESLEEGF